MRKPRLIYLMLMFTYFIQSCEDSNDDLNKAITISISNFTINIDENPTADLSLGTVQATTNQGDISFSIIEQTPNQAIKN